MVVGAGNRSSERYRLVYRSIEHSTLRGLCDKCRGSNPQVLPFVPPGGFGADIANFARVTFNFYELRTLADYDPSRNFSPQEVRLAISDARQAITWFQAGTQEQREAFLTQLLFKSR